MAKLKKPTTYTPAILEEMNKFNLKNFRDDLANAIIEAVASKFDLHLTIRILTSIWTTYNDDEYRAGIFGSLEKLLSDKKYPRRHPGPTRSKAWSSSRRCRSTDSSSSCS